jgi:hypothetical protein
MLNYNVNYIEPYRRSRNFLRGKVDYMWARTTNVAAGTQPPIVYGSGSISYVPYSPATLFFSSSLNTGSLSEGSAVGQPIDISVTGSGVWPLTGSNQLSIVIGSILGFNQSNILTLSAAAGNMNLSGSKISSSFVPVGNDEYNISFGISHTKGNIYNPIVNLNLLNASPVAPTNVNGHSASFNMVKDTNISLYSFNDVTGSTTSSFEYQYNFGVTSSLTASIQNNATGSTTMSISIPEAGVTTSSIYFNATSAGTKIITSSFVATNDNPYNVNATVTYNKGNISNSGIGWSASGSGNNSNLAITASFTIVKDVNVNKANVANMLIPTASEYTNEYAFNQTASISLGYTGYYTGSASQSYVYAESNLIIPELSVNISTNSTGSVLTSSFEAQTTIAHYSITASAIAYKTTGFDYLVVGGGAAGGNGTVKAGGGGGGAGAFYSGSITVPASSSYVITVGAGGVGTGDQFPQLNSGSFGSASKIEGYSSVFDNKKFFIVSASGGIGGADGLTYPIGAVLGWGGHGGNTGQLNYFYDSTITLSISASGAMGTSGSKTVPPGVAGGGGAGAYNDGFGPDGAGNGGNAGDGTMWTINGLTYAGGGGGGGSVTSGKVGGAGGAGGGGAGGRYDGRGGVAASNATFYGAGGGGGGTTNGFGSGDGGAGYQGIVIISYIASASIATGGTITYNTGSGRVFHTFTTDGTFTILPERL